MLVRENRLSSSLRSLSSSPRSLGQWFLAGLIGMSSLTLLALSNEVKEATHKQAYTIKPESPGKTLKLETFCVGPRGNLWMACRSQSIDGCPIVVT